MNRTNEETHAVEPGGGREPVAFNCPACGAATRRANAHFCATCGRGLRERAYAPADSLFASYHQQRNRPPMLFESTAVAGVPMPRAGRRRLFDNEGNTAAAIALVLVFSALVPFIGILFCPLAVCAGGFAFFEAWFEPRVGGTRLASSCIGFGFLIGGVQDLLIRLI